MAADRRRQRLLAGALFGVLAFLLWWQFAPTGTSEVGVKRAPVAGGRQPASAATPAQTLSAGVGLERLARVAPEPADGGRDPFVLGRSIQPEVDNERRGAAADGGMPVPSVPMVPLPPPGPPPPPPITVKFIGVVQRGDVGRVAVLSDGRNVYYGREGEIVDGRWRIVRIGEESLQIEYADGRGRQTVRLTG
jgi:hypothetical protein